MRRKNKRAILILFCAGVVCMICFAVGISVYFYNQWREKSYYESLAGSFAPPDDIWDASVPSEPPAEDEEP